MAVIVIVTSHFAALFPWTVPSLDALVELSSGIHHGAIIVVVAFGSGDMFFADDFHSRR